MEKKSIKVLTGFRLFIGMVLLALMSGISNAQIRLQPFLPTQVHVISTVPQNGDLNPYGVVFVPDGFPMGTIKPGDILVSNFNNNQNLQGTGTTIVSISPDDSSLLFFQSNTPVGLTTALNVLKKGFVLVGNFPSTDGTCGNATNGSIIVINNNGQQIQNIVDPDFIAGPWDSVLVDHGNLAKLFISNALTGTVVRFDLAVGGNGIVILNKTKIASGYQHQCDPVTFVDAPTGLAYDSIRDLLYVASTMDNTVYAIRNAGKTTQDHGKGFPIFSSTKHLHGPLAMIMAPNRNLIVSNNDAINPDPNHFSALVEFTPRGRFVKEITIDSSAGAAFGLNANKNRFAAVNDSANTLFVWTK